MYISYLSGHMGVLGSILFLIFMLSFCFKFRKDTKQCRKPNISIVLLAQNCEDNIEGFIRCLTSCLMNSGFFYDAEMIIIDQKSEDHTSLIIERLMKQYKYIKFMKMANCKADKICLSNTIKELCFAETVYTFSITGKVGYNFCHEIIQTLSKKQENRTVLNNYI